MKSIFNVQTQKTEQKKIMPKEESENANRNNIKNDLLIDYLDVIGEDEDLNWDKYEIIKLGQDNLELVRFAQYLSYKDYISIASSEFQNDPDVIIFDVKTNFCNIKHVDFYNLSLRNLSRLGQEYYFDIFNGSSSVMGIDKKNIVDSIKNRCENCRFCENKFPICPYAFAAVVEYMSKEQNCNVQDFYKKILGDSYNVFYKPSKINFLDNIKREIIECDSKSSRAAYLLMQSKCFTITKTTIDYIEFQYLPLCNIFEKSSLVYSILDFWKNKNAKSEIFQILNASNEIKRKNKCLDCEFEQCPHRLAAYFSYLGNIYKKDPIDIAYFAANNNTIANLNAGEHYKYNKFIEMVKNMPFISASVEEIYNIIRYIINRNKKNAVPCLPINIVLNATDDPMIEEFFGELYNFLWFFDYFKNRKSMTFKTLSVDGISLEKVIEEYEKAPDGTIFHIKQIELLDQQDKQNSYFLMKKFCRLLKEKRKVFTWVSGDKHLLDNFFKMYPDLSVRIFTYHIDMTEMNSNSVAKNVISNLRRDYIVEDYIQDAVVKYIFSEYEKSEIKSNSFIEWLCEKITFNHFNNDLEVSNILDLKDIPSPQPRREEKEIFADLNTLIGLNEVKSKLSEINDLAKYFIKVKRNDKSRPNLHMVFSGNAGTGKTTVARLMAEILYSIGYIQQNKLIVSSGKDFIAEYLGQSQQKTVQICEQAYGGVLFIDEAYQLNPFSHGHYTDTLKLDAINELIQQMENNRDRLIVIFAGYTEEMKEFIKKANPGLESRIAYTINFPDYSDEELLTIFKSIAKEEKLALSEGAELRVKETIISTHKNVVNFGNARYARNLFERSLMLHAKNTSELAEDDSRLYIMTEEDIAI